MKLRSLIAVAAVISAVGCQAQERDITPFTAPDSILFGQPSDAMTEMRLQEPDASASPSGDSAHASMSNTGIPARAAQTNFSYYFKETWMNPSLFTAPAFRASLRMASPPGNGLTRYPNEWRQGEEAFGRNFGDAFAARISTHTAQFLTAALTREDPSYMPSSSRHFLARSSHALLFTFVDRSTSGQRLPALSNFAGAAAGGLVGNAYLPAGFRGLTHAGQRATFQFGVMAAGNLFREFAPQIPNPVRGLFALIAR